MGNSLDGPSCTNWSKSGGMNQAVRSRKLTYSRMRVTMGHLKGKAVGHYRILHGSDGRHLQNDSRLAPKFCRRR